MAYPSPQSSELLVMPQPQPQPHQEMSALQRHVSFFDQNQDNRILPWETFNGFRAIGCSRITSVAATIVLNIGLSIATRKGRLPGLLFPIEVDNITNALHTGDTGVYDRDGRFVPEKFEELFHRFAHLNKKGLNFLEIQLMVLANKEKDEIGGTILAFVEWNLLYILARKRGLLRKETIRGMYDGTLFPQLAEEHKKDNQAKQT